MWSMHDVGHIFLFIPEYYPGSGSCTFVIKGKTIDPEKRNDFYKGKILG